MVNPTQVDTNQDGIGDACQCLSGSCDDQNPCTDDSCSPTTGCSHTNNSLGCNDGNACTQTDSCQAGVCTGSNPVVCTASDQCHVAGTCDTGTGLCSNPNAANGTTCSDGNPCTSGDSCVGGACQGGTPTTAPPETQNVNADPDKVTFTWSAAAFATRYGVVRGSTGALPVGPGGGDEVCFGNLPGTSLVDPELPANGTGFWYLSRGENDCGLGSYGNQSDGTPRITTTCP